MRASDAAPVQDAETDLHALSTLGEDGEAHGRSQGQRCDHVTQRLRPSGGRFGLAETLAGLG